MSLPQSTWLKSPPSARLRIGACVVDVPLREIARADGSTSRVTLKSIAVLLVLAEHAGTVVSRESLLTTVWAGTMPTMDVVTQAVASLRKALGGEGETPGYVETIPKTGYRLLADVEWLPDPPSPVKASASIPARSGSGWRIFATAAAALVLLATLGWSMAGWQDTPEAGPGSGSAIAMGPSGEAGYTLLTSRPGLELSPALSPDGAWMAYSMSPGRPGQPSAIFIQSAQPTPPHQLTVPPPGHSDRTPRWSPDGRQIMFARVDGAAGCELRLVPATGGVERLVGRCDRFSSSRYDWLPDGSGIVAGLLAGSSDKPSPLAILHLDTGRWESMSYPIAPGNIDYDPRFSSDGTRLGFRRNLVRAEVRIMPAQGGPPQHVTRLHGEINGWDWAPDDRSLLVALGHGVPRLVRYNLASQRSETLGRITASSLDVAPRGSNMVFSTGEASIAMFRYPLPLRAGSHAQALFPSTGNDVLPSPSPDGRMIAFHSDRSRDTRLWIGEPAVPDRLRMIQGFIPLRMHPPQWSADGSRLLVVGDPVDPAAAGPRLYEVDVPSGRIAAVALGGIPYFAQYLPGGRLLALVDLGSGKWSLQIVDLAAPGRVLAQLDEIGEARFDPASGKVYFVRLDKPGLWRTDPTLSAPALVDEKVPAVYWMTLWTVLDGQAMALRTVPGCRAEWYWLGSAPKAGTGCLDRERNGVPYLAMVPSRDGEWLYASMSMDEGNRDIGVMDIGSSSASVPGTTR